MGRKKKQCSPEFKTKVGMAALKNEQTVAKLAIWYEIHPTMINNSERNLLKGGADIFDKGQKKQKNMNAKIDELYRQIGKLKVERNFLAKKLDF